MISCLVYIPVVQGPVQSELLLWEGITPQRRSVAVASTANNLILKLRNCSQTLWHFLHAQLQPCTTRLRPHRRQPPVCPLKRLDNLWTSNGIGERGIRPLFLRQNPHSDHDCIPEPESSLHLTNGEFDAGEVFFDEFQGFTLCGRDFGGACYFRRDAVVVVEERRVEVCLGENTTTRVHVVLEWEAEHEVGEIVAVPPRVA